MAKKSPKQNIGFVPDLCWRAPVICVDCKNASVSVPRPRSLVAYHLLKPFQPYYFDVRHCNIPMNFYSGQGHLKFKM